MQRRRTVPVKNKGRVLILCAVILAAALAIPCFYYVEARFSYFFLEDYLKTHKIADDVSFSSGNTTEIRLNPSSDPIFYLACLPAEVDNNKALRLSFSHFKTLELDGNAFYSGDDIYDFAKEAEDTPVTMRIFARRGELLYDGYMQFIFTDQLPSVYLSTSENAIEAVNLTDYEDTAPIHVSSVLTIINADGSVDSLNDAQIHRHGNTSFDFYEPRPYNLDLSAAANLLGMSPCKKWVLKANSQYPTVLMKNRAALEIAERIGCLGVPESRFVNLYVNGTYYGLYLLCQRVQSVELMNREGMKALVELDVRYDSREHYFECDGEGMAIHLPKDISGEDVKEIERLFDDAVNAIRSESGYDKYIDMDSFMRMYLLQDFFVQTDIDGDSLYFYVGNDNRIYAGPPWDFDCSCGHITSGPYHERMAMQARLFDDFGSLFFSDLAKSEDFRKKCAGYYEECMSEAVHDYLSTVYKADLYMINSSEEMSITARENQMTKNRVDDDPKALGEWLNDRALFLDDYYRNEDGYRNVRFVFAWGSMTSASGAGKPIGFLPDNEHPGNDDDIWGKIDGFADDTRQIADDNTVINDDTSLFAVYDEESMTVKNGFAPITLFE